MAPKARNVEVSVGSKRNRKGEVVGSSSSQEPFQKFGKKAMERIVDVTRTKVLDTSHSPILSTQKWQTRDDSVMARMFVMEELQLRIGGHPVTDNEMETLAERYPLTENAAYLYRVGSAFQEPPDDDMATADEEMV
ncbi:hypothetical protein H5410_045358 [Solanum commersonii]|uniref:Uncharacterized protein n=1 Tax=Solanum commersonii TaxID=4109 RepID=A0A9J5XCH9_SOLCO|nr:hypothetical protein H5410_045358 [Solanum commersonii]